MTGPGDEVAAAGGRGRLRASHADREQVIDVLKAAYVRGMLAKDELDARLSQTFASRTPTELAVLTADLPAGLAGPRPPGGEQGNRGRSPGHSAGRPAAARVPDRQRQMGPNLPHPHVLLPHSLDDRRDRDARLMAPTALTRAAAATVRAAPPGVRTRAGRRARRWPGPVPGPQRRPCRPPARSREDSDGGVTTRWRSCGCGGLQGHLLSRKHAAGGPAWFPGWSLPPGRCWRGPSGSSANTDRLPPLW